MTRELVMPEAPWPHDDEYERLLTPPKPWGSPDGFTGARLYGDFVWGQVGGAPEIGCVDFPGDDPLAVTWRGCELDLWASELAEANPEVRFFEVYLYGCPQGDVEV